MTLSLAGPLSFSADVEYLKQRPTDSRVYLVLPSGFCSGYATKIATISLKE